MGLFKKVSLLSSVLVFSFGVNSMAKESTAPKEKIAEENVADTFQCETFRDRQLSVLKEKLTENCNLNKPFSTSLSVSMGENTYLYCCHKN